MNRKIYLTGIMTGILAAVAVFFTVLVGRVDVKAIGPEGTKVGFAGINSFFVKAIGVHKIFYTISEVLGYLAIAVAGLFAVIGLLQWIRRKSLFKVDANILAMGFMFIIVIMIYFFFEKVIINYRPVLLEGGPEASYPSSHTMIACCILGAAMMECNEVVTRKSARDLIMRILAGLIAAIVLCRFLSGVHWFTDIIGALLISVAVLSGYYLFILIIKGFK